MKKGQMEVAPASMMGGKDEEIHEHEVHSAAEDLLRAEKHKKNHKLMKKVHKHLSDKAAQISSIQDLKSARNKMMREGDPADAANESADEEEAELATKNKK